ncbi:hypothetical protein HD806DRAFT_430483 [Xylariaceae sp. AK1471]|nr:hypothetical protein HD806DRAFT_430483 [Xylariaceae sp. AK1471]
MLSSREPTMTLERDGDSHEAADGEYTPEAVTSDMLSDGVNNQPSDRLIIAVDFGTTYSCVSYVALEKHEVPQYLARNRIHSIHNFPNDWNTNPADPMKRQVPTEVIYPLDRSFRDREDLDIVEEREVDIGIQADALGSNYVMNPNRDDEDSDMDDFMSDDSTLFRWGYGVHEAWALPATHSDPTNKPLSRFKLLLDDSPTTQIVRDDLEDTLRSLKRRKIIKKPLQVIADFLTCLLRHTKSELEEKGYDNSWKVEIVLCVPAIWSSKACRDMQTAMAIAMKKARFEGADIQNNSIENLFIVSEPEAAAAYVLAMEPSIKRGDTFVLLDAGGGTIDANTYTVSMTTPLRLRREVVQPGGGLYGSSYLNEGFRQVLRDLLRDETYLENGVETIDGIIEKIMINEFEYRVKRSFDYYLTKGVKQISVSGLRDNPAKHFQHGCLNIPTSTIRAIFLRLLEGIASIMEDQIDRALQAGCRVEKVILIGGFAASVSLKKYTEQRLKRFSQARNCDIELIRPSNTTNAVASGAVLRAFNKEQGPQRQARSSYGILRTEPYKNHPEHNGVNPSYDRDDGLPYIKDTVDWILPLGAEVPSVWECRPFVCSHTIACSPVRKLICRELLYVSDRATHSHYRLAHPMNEGAELIGEIVVDFTYLRDQGLIHPIEPKINENGKKIGVRHYKINYTMAIRVVDRDLRCFAIRNGQLIQKCRINIASAFRPGVK